jgi:hypothetical protein
MGGRAVGGAGAGCAGLSLVGVLVSVGIVVWLGAQAFDATGSGRSSPTLTDGAEVVLDRDDLDALEDGAAAGGRSIAARPTGPMGASATLAVDVAGFAPGPVELRLCLTRPAPDAEASGCAVDAVGTAEVDATGAATTTVEVPRSLTVGEVIHDCGAAADVCSLVAHAPGDPRAGIGAPLAFDEPAGPEDAPRPGD